MARLAPEPIHAQLEAERERREKASGVLLAVLRRLLKPHQGSHVIVTGLRRMLRMAGLDPGVAELAIAVMAVGGRYGRVSLRDRRRAFVDVDLRPEQIFRVARVIGGEWEQSLAAEGLTPEPKRRYYQAPGELAQNAAIASAVWDAMSTYLELRGHELTPEDRQIIGLYLEGQSEHAIATALEMPYETVRDRFARHRRRAGLGLSPRLQRARRYLERHQWGAEPGQERAIWERFSGGDGYRTIARELRIEWRQVVAVLHKHRIRAGIALD